MTRKDFELIARVLNDQGAPMPLIQAMANALATTNPRFDERKFVEAATK